MSQEQETTLGPSQSVAAQATTEVEGCWVGYLY
jgi:hypothetical protein